MLPRTLPLFFALCPRPYGCLVLAGRLFHSLGKSRPKCPHLPVPKVGDPWIFLEARIIDAARRREPALSIMERCADMDLSLDAVGIEHSRQGGG